MKKLLIVMMTGGLMALSVKTNAQSWSLTGNAGTNSATDFIGTSDNKPLKIKTNNQVRMLLKTNGYVGIGTQTPSTRLHVNGVITATGGTSSDWNTAFGWGDHALAGYLTSFTELDPKVGANVTNFVSKWDGAALVGSNIFNSGTNFGLNTSTMIGSANFVVQSPNASGFGGMYINQSGAGLKPFYGYAVNGVGTCWTSFDQTTGNWGVFNNGERFVVDNTGQVGIGTTTPSYFLDIQAGTALRALNAVSSVVGSSGQIVNFGRTNAPASANDIVQITVPAGSPNDFQFIEADKGGSNRFQVNGDGSVGVGFSTISTARLNVDGSNPDNKKIYGVYASADSASSVSAAIYGEHTSTTSDGRGVYGKSSGGAGIGYGVFGESGYVGLRGLASGSTYTGTAYGVYGTASGSTVGTRIGVYGSASGAATAEGNWGGYFPTKVYTSQIRVGTTGGATGFIACIGGKLIAEEVRVELETSWPDYVFADGYELMPLEQLKKEINQHKHLPGIPSASQIEEQGGVDLGAMQTKLVEKVEELTLYIIQLKEQNDKLQELNEKLQVRMSAIENNK
ncbi:MAG: hypothetical protein IPN36_05300 [Bacteroidetes bacterium]|nr:hypothetical protein [Bacteroidota bacterium]